MRLSDENPGLSASTASEKLSPKPKPRSDSSGRRFQPILASHTPDASLEVEQDYGAALANYARKRIPQITEEKEEALERRLLGIEGAQCPTAD
jgi:hypothetical protein